MNYRSRIKDARSPISFNATPMIDVIFMLTIFFMLVSRVTSEEQVQLDLPDPEKSKAVEKKMPDRVVISCWPAGTDSDSSGVFYQYGADKPEPLSAISNRIAILKSKNPKAKIVIRADKKLHYAKVRDLMTVIASHDIDILNIMAHVDDGASD